MDAASGLLAVAHDAAELRLYEFCPSEREVGVAVLGTTPGAPCPMMWAAFLWSHVPLVPAGPSAEPRTGCVAPGINQALPALAQRMQQCLSSTLSEECMLFRQLYLHCHRSPTALSEHALTAVHCSQAPIVILHAGSHRQPAAEDLPARQPAGFQLCLRCQVCSRLAYWQLQLCRPPLELT